MNEWCSMIPNFKQEKIWSLNVKLLIKNCLRDFHGFGASLKLILKHIPTKITLSLGRSRCENYNSRIANGHQENSAKF